MDEERLSSILKQMGRYMSGRDRCRSEIELYLDRKRLCKRSESSAVLDSLEASGLLDEERFARYRLEYRLGQGYGPRYIQQEFRRLRIDDEVMGRVLDIEEELYIDAARSLLNRKRRSILKPGATEEPNQKLTRYLMGRGFSHTQTKRVLNGELEVLE